MREPLPKNECMLYVCHMCISIERIFSVSGFLDTKIRVYLISLILCNLENMVK